MSAGSGPNHLLPQPVVRLETLACGTQKRGRVAGSVGVKFSFITTGSESE